MLRKLICAAAPVILLNACVKPEQVIIGGCEKLKETESCTGNKNNPVVNINIQGKIDVNPPNVCAQPGAVLEIRINPNPESPGTVAVIPKNLTDTWLVGVNTGQVDKILFKIPEDTAGNHDYSIVTASGECVDPRVHVEN